jgi:hypothetical protein
MSGSSISEKVGVAFGFLVSLSAFFWLLPFWNRPQEITSHFGFVSAEFSILCSLAFFWGAITAYLTRKRIWPARTCNLAALSFVVPGCLMSWWTFGESRFWLWPLFASMGGVASLISRKLAYPRLKTEQIYAPKSPVTLFPK